jgi:hypothetical protein
MLTRRSFLSLFMGLVGWLAGCGPRLPDRQAVLDLAASLHSDVPKDQKRRRRRFQLARLYLEATPEEQDADVLVGLLSEDLASVPAGPDGLQQSLAALVSIDFREGRTVELDGWILSLSEARLHALSFVTAASQ